MYSRRMGWHSAALRLAQTTSHGLANYQLPAVSLANTALTSVQVLGLLDSNVPVSLTLQRNNRYCGQWRKAAVGEVERGNGSLAVLLWQ
jgi:hypothetical protein